MVELVGHDLEGEPKASCLDCAMLDTASGLNAFDPRTKCCTYLPIVPNYLVGAALADPRLDDVGGRASVRARIDERVGVTPLGLERGRLDELLADRSAVSFGRTPTLRCPHYEASSGKCGIWLHRNAVCSTWFCKHDRGRVGQAFWISVRDLLSRIEFDLTSWVVLELDAPMELAGPPDPKAPRSSLEPEDLEGRVPDEVWAKRWGTWAGRELELYARADELVRTLSYAEVMAICGPEVGHRQRVVERTLAARQTTVVPPTALLRKLDVIAHGEPTVLGSYTGTDPLSVPSALVPLLPVFRGQPLDEARAELEEEHDIQIGDDLIAKLVDFGILEAGD
jgi:hypothetical protein